MELTAEGRELLRRLAARMELETPLKDLAASTRQAIVDATDFVEMSDQGVMTRDIEEYLQAVFKAFKNCDLPPDAALARRQAVGKSDPVGRVYLRELEPLSKQFKAGPPQ